MIGNSLALILRFLGNGVITDNHLGDWGSQFGMIIYGYRNFLDQAAYERDPVEELARLYRLTRQLVDYQDAKKKIGELENQLTAAREALDAQKARCAEAKAADDAEKTKESKDALKKSNKERERLTKAVDAAQEKFDGAKSKIDGMESDPELAQLAEGRETIGTDVLNETSKLHHGDEENLALWRQFMPQCLSEVDKIYERLGVQFDESLGESFYNDRLGPLVERLKADGVARETEGAVGVFLEGQEVPMLIQKSDGAYLYATTDLATLEYRRDRFQPDAILYVVDFRQSHHFEQLFEAAKYIDMGDVELTHVKFGTVLGDDGKPFKTRAGDAVGLKSLLDEAEVRASAIIEATTPLALLKTGFLKKRSAKRRAASVLGARLCRLSQNRESDYVFSYDKMLAMNGNTATYMQYAYGAFVQFLPKAKSASTRCARI